MQFYCNNRNNNRSVDTLHSIKFFKEKGTLQIDKFSSRI